MLRVTTYLHDSIATAASSSTSGCRIILYRCNGANASRPKMISRPRNSKAIFGRAVSVPFHQLRTLCEKRSGLLSSSSSMYVYMIHNNSSFVNQFCHFALFQHINEAGKSCLDLLHQRTRDK